MLIISFVYFISKAIVPTTFDISLVLTMYTADIFHELYFSLLF